MRTVSGEREREEQSESGAPQQRKNTLNNILVR